MIANRTAVALAVLITLSPVSRTEAQYLAGKDRADFIAGVLSSCNADQRKTADMANIPGPIIDQMCRCFASGLADRLTAAQLRAENESVTQPVVKSTMRACYETIKSDIIRYRGYGK
jgi:hypothetical protein